MYYYNQFQHYQYFKFSLFQTRVGAELPQPQTQSRLKAHSLSPAHGPASVPRRSAPRGSSSRRLAPPKRRAPWRARSYAGAAQYPCAEHRGGKPCVAPSSTPTEPGPDARGAPVLPSRAVNMLPWVMGYPPSGHGRSVTSLPGPGPGTGRQLYPARPHAGRGVDGHVPAGPRPSRDPPRVPTRAAGSQGDTCPQLNAAGSLPGRHAPLPGAARTRGERLPITSRAP